MTNPNLMGRLQAVIVTVAALVNRTQMRTDEAGPHVLIAACGDLRERDMHLLTERINLEFETTIPVEKITPDMDVEEVLNLIEEALKTGYITISPNYSPMFEGFKNEIVPATNALIRHLLNTQVPYRRNGLSEKDYLDMQAANLEKALQTINSIASGFAIALGAASSGEDIEKMREVASKMQEDANKAFTKFSNDVMMEKHLPKALRSADIEE